MKINCAIIVNCLEEQEKSLNNFKEIKNKNFFTFDSKIKSLNLLKSKKNFFSELSKYFDGEQFFYLYPDEELVLFDEEEIYKSHYNFIVDEWIIKLNRSNSEKNEVSKIFIKSNFKNIKKFDDDWSSFYCEDHFVINKLQEYIMFNDIKENELYLYYHYVFEILKQKKASTELNNFVKSIVQKNPTFVELINLWGDYLYENNLFNDAKTCYLNALKMADHRQIYDFLPMIPQMHKKHPEKMVNNINNILKKYDNTLD